MTGEEIRQLLEDYGYPPHVVRAGGDGLVAAWDKFVADVRRGYRLGLEDYRNGLDVRTLLAQAGLADDAEDSDRAFRAALDHTGQQVWESAAEDPFWIFGYPSNASGRLLEDLEAEGLTE